MPDVDTSFGKLVLPYPAGAESDPLIDPPVEVLLGYLGFWLRAMLNDKLASMGGGRPEATDENYADACPVANRFPYDPFVGEIWRRNPKPALYCWWKGSSVTTPKTMVYDLRTRELGLLWVFCEVQAPRNDELRHGALAAVDAVITRAIRRGSHPGYGHGSDDPGTPVWRSAGVAEIRLGQTTPGKLAPIPEGLDRRDTSPGQVTGYYQAVAGSIFVSERVPADSLRVPEDLNTDQTLTIATNEEGDVLDVVDLIEVVIPSPPVGP
jgi:hypothetical protein